MMAKSMPFAGSEQPPASPLLPDGVSGSLLEEPVSAESSHFDKRYEANRLVRQRIAKALIRLMSAKKFSDITVTDIVTKANVARSSYYRNFDSKEDVLISISDGIMDEYRARLHQLGDDFLGYEGVLLIFRYFRAYRAPLLCVYRAGLIGIYLEIFDMHVETMAGDMAYNDIRRYRMHAFSGALFNVFLKWLENGMREKPEDMARMMCEMLSRVPAGSS